MCNILFPPLLLSYGKWTTHIILRLPRNSGYHGVCSLIHGIQLSVLPKIWLVSVEKCAGTIYLIFLRYKAYFVIVVFMRFISRVTVTKAVVNAYRLLIFQIKFKEHYSFNLNTRLCHYFLGFCQFYFWPKSKKTMLIIKLNFKTKYNSKNNRLCNWCGFFFLIF